MKTEMTEYPGECATLIFDSKGKFSLGFLQQSKG